MSTFPERVAQRAQTVAVARVLLSIVAAPFYVLGFVVGLLAAMVLWTYAACAIGFADARKKSHEDAR